MGGDDDSNIPIYAPGDDILAVTDKPKVRYQVSQSESVNLLDLYDDNKEVHTEKRPNPQR